MSKLFCAMLAGVAALAILIGGCGGGDDTATGGTTAEVELTKAQLIKRADASCSKQNETLSQHFGEFSLENPIKNGEPTQEQSREFSEEFIVPYLEGRIELLEGLSLPAADENDVEAIIAATEDGLELVEEKVRSGTSNQDPLAQAETLSRKFGFKVCGET